MNVVDRCFRVGHSMQLATLLYDFVNEGMIE